jgi:hypothetical protein
MDYKKLNYDDKETLYYLYHDKESILPDDFKGKLRGIEKALKNYSEVAPSLYRGLYPQEVEAIGELEVGKVFSLKRYTSFSERLKIGLSFGEGTRYVIYLKNGIGFNYWKFITEDLTKIKNEDPEEFENVDGGYILEFVNEEKEWIFSKEAKYKIEKFKTAHGFTVIECSMA